MAAGTLRMPEYAFPVASLPSGGDVRDTAQKELLQRVRQSGLNVLHPRKNLANVF